MPDNDDEIRDALAECAQDAEADDDRPGDQAPAVQPEQPLLNSLEQTSTAVGSLTAKFRSWRATRRQDG